jgi:hypothetical protein
MVKCVFIITRKGTQYTVYQSVLYKVQSETKET